MKRLNGTGDTAEARAPLPHAVPRAWTACVRRLDDVRPWGKPRDGKEWKEETRKLDTRSFHFQVLCRILSLVAGMYDVSDWEKRVAV